MYASLGITGSKALLVQGFANCYFRHSVCSSWPQHLRGSRTNCQFNVSTCASRHPWTNLNTLQFHHALPWSCWSEETAFVRCHRLRCIIRYSCCYRCDEPTSTRRSPRDRQCCCTTVTGFFALWICCHELTLFVQCWRCYDLYAQYILLLQLRSC